MDINQTVLRLGATPVSAGELLLAAAMLALVLLLMAAIFAFRAQAGRQRDAATAAERADELELRLAEMAGSLKNFAEMSQGSQAELGRTVDVRLGLVSERLGLSLNHQTERTSASLNQLNERLAVIDAAQKNLTALSSEMVSLKDILANKQARGAYGQGRMEAIIRDGLPGTAYSFQSTLSTGVRPDCLVSLPDSVLKLVIDSKFPLEAFSALKDAKGPESQRAAETRLRGDVLRHVKDIADKYLLPGETHESAIMFVPSESIYADLYERFDDVIQKAHRSRVVIASPNILMLLVQTLQAVIKDVAMREQTSLIKVEVARLLEDVNRLRDRVGDLQRHFGAATADIEKLTVSADKVAKRALRIESLDLGEEQPSLPAPDARPRLVERG